MDEWWAHALALLEGEATSEDASMTVEIELEPFERSLRPDAPCVDPDTRRDDAGIDVLICEP